MNGNKEPVERLEMRGMVRVPMAGLQTAFQTVCKQYTQPHTQPQPGLLRLPDTALPPPPAMLATATAAKAPHSPQCI